MGGERECVCVFIGSVREEAVSKCDSRLRERVRVSEYCTVCVSKRERESVCVCMRERDVCVRDV